MHLYQWDHRRMPVTHWQYKHVQYNSGWDPFQQIQHPTGGPTKNYSKQSNQGTGCPNSAPARSTNNFVRMCSTCILKTRTFANGVLLKTFLFKIKKSLWFPPAICKSTRPLYGRSSYHSMCPCGFEMVWIFSASIAIGVCGIVSYTTGNLHFDYYNWIWTSVRNIMQKSSNFWLISLRICASSSVLLQVDLYQGWFNKF